MYFYISFMLLFFSFFFVFLGFIFLSNNISFMLDWEVFSVNSVSVSMTLYVDWMSLFFSGVVLVISSMVILYSYDYMSHDLYSSRFLFLVFLFIVSMMLMIYSLNMISILLGWDGLGLVSYCLVIYYQNSMSYSSGMLTILTNRVGDVFILIGIGWIFNFGSFHFLYYLDENYSWTNMFVTFMILAAFTKSAQIPFSSWLPAAMAAPTPVSSLVHSSTLVTAGVYLLIRFGSLLMVNCYLDFFFMISVFTMFMAGVGANFDYDLKKVVAFSTLSQLGLMMSILFSGNFDLSYFHLLSHAFFKSLLFMCSGLIIHSMCDSQDIRYMGYVCLDKPYTTSCFLISNFSLCGLFFLSGFYSKDLIVESFMFFGDNFVKLLIYLLSISLTVCYTVRLIFYVLVGGITMFSFRSVDEGNSSFFSLIVLVIFSVIFGGIYSWLVFETPFVYFFPFYMKVSILMFMFFGLAIYLFFFKLNANFSFLSNFLGSMWYLVFLGSSYLNFGYYNFCYNYKFVIDDSWGETYFSTYLSSLISIFSLKFNYLIFNNLKYYMFSFFVLMVYMMF
uniref:NADH-ubiquinone oxidoreductase chain 5 n=1 Tax=Trachypeplus jacobsoni TaxID=2172479 RepID=A0A343WNR9_9HEMI|nr:NADH dehydrogenase subunit 5 [Trachypeplus jacobsoni]AWD31645.1 NADH dehydrogenase subunit 5 [Trachypeplus jacobsoni]